MPTTSTASTTDRSFRDVRVREAAPAEGPEIVWGKKTRRNKRVAH
jgi:hypothetical protein